MDVLCSCVSNTNKNALSVGKGIFVILYLYISKARSRLRPNLHIICKMSTVTSSGVEKLTSTIFLRTDNPQPISTHSTSICTSVHQQFSTSSSHQHIYFISLMIDTVSFR